MGCRTGAMPMVIEMRGGEVELVTERPREVELAVPDDDDWK